MSTPFEPGYPRDLVGYGRHPPHAKWPHGARIAVQFVLNYEEGAENCILHGDAGSETFLSEIPNAVAFAGARHMNMESIYEYGSRAGLWRLLRAFEERGLPLTVFAAGMALARNPEAAAAFVAGAHEVASHGWRWIDYHGVDEATERAHIALAVQAIASLTGTAPLGWYTGRTSENTRRLVAEHGGFLYDADSYADDLPYWCAWPGATTSSSPMRSIPTTCASPPPTDSATATISSRTCATPSIRCMRKANARRACSRSDCIAASRGAPRAWRGWRASSTTSSAPSACGSAGAWTSRAIGMKTFRPETGVGPRFSPLPGWGSDPGFAGQGARA